MKHVLATVLLDGEAILAMNLLTDRQKYLRLYLAKLRKLCDPGIQAVANTGLIRLAQTQGRMPSK